MVGWAVGRVPRKKSQNIRQVRLPGYVLNKNTADDGGKRTAGSDKQSQPQLYRAYIWVCRTDAAFGRQCCSVVISACCLMAAWYGCTVVVSMYAHESLRYRILNRPVLRWR